MSEADDIDALAGEYVLGTLDAAERAAVNARRAGDPALDRAIAAWERRLAPLDAAAGDVAPPPELFGRVQARIDGLPLSSPGPDTNVVSLLEAQARRWRTRALAASALAACLTVVIALRETMFQPQPQSYVAAFVRDDELPAFMMTIDLKSRQVTVRPIGASQQPGKTYQLWIASERLGPRPRSLGILGDGSRPGQVVLSQYEPDLLQRATFGVSLEPAGGSPTGQPTSPALHAKLLPATP